MPKKAKPTPADPLSKAEIEDVNNAHNEIERKEKGTLKYALIAGEILNKAVENIKGRTWEIYLAETFPKIKPSTDRLYRYLATSKPTLEEKAGGANALADWSIRRARSELGPGSGSGGSRTDTQKTYDRFVKLTGEQRAEVLAKAGIRPNPIQPVGPLGESPRQSPIATLVDAIVVEPAPDVVAETIKANLAPAEQREVARILEDIQIDPVEEAKSIIDRLDTEQLNEVADYLGNLIEQRENAVKEAAE